MTTVRGFHSFGLALLVLIALGGAARYGTGDAVAADSVPGRSSSRAFSAGSIGYIGCSISRAAVDGYHSIDSNKNLFWPSYPTGGGHVGLWADPHANYWTNFDRMIGRYGQPLAVWVELCEQAQKQTASYQDVQTMFAILKRHAPNAIYYISPINIYQPLVGLCRAMGPTGEGETDTLNWRTRTVSDGLALQGPEMGPITAADVNGSGCEPNQSGIIVLGNNLHSFFDKMAAPNVTGVSGAPLVYANPSPFRIASGASATISWSSVNATSCTSPLLRTDGKISGSVTVSPATTTGYPITCTGSGGSYTAWATVTVN